MGVVAFQSCCTHSQDAKRPPGWAVWRWRRWTCLLVSLCLSCLPHCIRFEQLEYWGPMDAGVSRPRCTASMQSGVQSCMSARLCHIYMLHAVEVRQTCDVTVHRLPAVLRYSLWTEAFSRALQRRCHMRAQRNRPKPMQNWQA